MNVTLRVAGADRRPAASRPALALVLMVPVLGCSAASFAPSTADSTPQPDGSPNGDASTSTLSSDQLSSLCDATTAMLGGYHRTYTCEGGFTSTADNQAECVAYLRRCSVTVGEVDACARARTADPCSLPGPCDALKKCS